MRVLVTGGTGNLGRVIVRLLPERGHEVRVMSRRSRPEATPAEIEWAEADILTGSGVEASLEGIDAVIHAASDARNPATVDVDGTRKLISAAQAVGIQHIAYISIVGIDSIDYGYYRSKLAAERLIEESDVPYSILRATQFHSLINSMISAAARLPLVMPLPTNFKFQSVLEYEVAEKLAKIIESGPGGRSPDFGGPEVLSLREMAETWMEINHSKKWLLGLPIPGNVANAFRAGLNTCPDEPRGRMTWRDWLVRRAANREQSKAPRSS